MAGTHDGALVDPEHDKTIMEQSYKVVSACAGVIRLWDCDP